MQKKRLIMVLVTLIAACAIMTAVAMNSTTLTWEKTFEVTKPQITAKINIGNYRIVGFPMKITVSLRIQIPFLQNYTKCWDHEMKHCNESIYSINGTYSVNLLWFNATDNQWQLLETLQSETNVTITCRWYTNIYFFAPTMEGQYKVVVTFTTDSETQIFTSGD